MMIRWQKLSDTEKQNSLARPESSQSETLQHSVTDIIAQVRSGGDNAIFALNQKFDGVSLNSLRLTEHQKQALVDELEDECKDAITLAYNNITAFHQAQKPSDVSVETSKGVQCELHHVALESVGLYIPGGTAPLPSTVLMLGATAKVAGCAQKILCTPPNKKGLIHPAIVFAAKVCDIDDIYLVGGAQAVAAMAFGTETIPKVDKIFGPGNSFVTEAKKQVSMLPGGAAIDMPAGPSEVLVIADANANPAYVASDLLSQAEHGIDSQAILVSESEALIDAVKVAVSEQLAQLSRKDITAQAMDNARYILANDIEQAVLISNAYAPEHLIVQTENPRGLLPKLKHAGSIFLGPWSPESAGDYASGTNHVLPTYGYARNYSSLGLMDFCRRFTVQELSREGLKAIGPAIVTLAETEGLDAHANAVALRLKELDS